MWCNISMSYAYTMADTSTQVVEAGNVSERIKRL